MAIQAVDINETVEYKLKQDDEDPTVWIIGALDTRIRTMIEDISFEYEANPNSPGDAMARATFNVGRSELEMVQFGLKGFRNFKNGTGDISFKTEARTVNGKVYQVVDETVIQIIPRFVISELAEEIRRINRMGEQDAKN